MSYLYQLAAHENTLLCVERGEIDEIKAADILKLQLDYMQRSLIHRNEKLESLGLYRKAMNELRGKK